MDPSAGLLVHPCSTPLFLRHQTTHEIRQDPNFVGCGLIHDHMTVLIAIILVLLRIDVLFGKADSHHRKKKGAPGTAFQLTPVRCGSSHSPTRLLMWTLSQNALRDRCRDVDMFGVIACKTSTIWLWLTVRHGKIHHAIKNGKPSINLWAMASMAMLVITRG